MPAADGPGTRYRRRRVIYRCETYLADARSGFPLGCGQLHDQFQEQERGQKRRVRVAPSFFTGGADTVCVQHIFQEIPPPYHVTQDDVSAPLQRLEVEKIISHQSVRGRGGVIAVLYLSLIHI